MKRFTIEEIRNYILKQDSLGDVLYNLKAEKIEEANEPEEELGEDLWNDLEDSGLDKPLDKPLKF